LTDRMANPWGTRTPFGRDGEWPLRVDQFLEAGVGEEGCARITRVPRAGRMLVLAAAVLAGRAVGLLFEVSEAALAVLFAFLAGGVVMNVLKEELPEERESRFWAFVLGAGLYAAVLLVAF